MRTREEAAVQRHSRTAIRLTTLAPKGRTVSSGKVAPSASKRGPPGETRSGEMTGTCQHGSICLGAGGFSGKLCQEPCTLDEDPWAVCDIGRHTCFVAVDDEGNDLPFGVCRY